MDVMGEELSPDADPRRAMLQRAQEVRLLSAQMLQFRAEIQDTRMELLRQSQLQRRLILRLNNNIIRLSNRPALMSVRTFRGQFGATSGQLAHPTQEQTTTTHAPDSLTNTNASTSSRNASQQTTATAAARQPLQSVQNTNESTSSCNASQQPTPTAACTTNQATNPATAQVVAQTRGLSRVAKLSKCPRSLYDLWKEYVTGFSGNKPARDFNSSERGACRFVYAKRNHVWQLVVKLTRMGYSSDKAIDKIYDVYGHNTSVTNIIKGIVADKKNGGNNAFREILM